MFDLLNEELTSQDLAFITAAGNISVNDLALMRAHLACPENRGSSKVNFIALKSAVEVSNVAAVKLLTAEPKTKKDPVAEAIQLYIPERIGELVNAALRADNLDITLILLKQTKIREYLASLPDDAHLVTVLKLKINLGQARLVCEMTESMWPKGPEFLPASLSAIPRLMRQIGPRQQLIFSQFKRNVTTFRFLKIPDPVINLICDFSYDTDDAITSSKISSVLKS